MAAVGLWAVDLKRLGLGSEDIALRVPGFVGPLLGVAAAASIALSLVARRRWLRIEKRLVQLLDGARRLARGRVDQDLATPTERDVVGLLAHSFTRRFGARAAITAGSKRRTAICASATKPCRPRTSSWPSCRSPTA